MIFFQYCILLVRFHHQYLDIFNLLSSVRHVELFYVLTVRIILDMSDIY